MAQDPDGSPEQCKFLPILQADSPEEAERLKQECEEL